MTTQHEFITIRGRAIGNGNPTYVIAEVGSNHDGKLDQAKQLLDVAAEAGCDAVKIQIPIAEECYPPKTKFGGIYGDQEIADVIRRNEIPADWVAKLVDYGHKAGLDVGASADGFIGLKMMIEGGVDFIKIPSFTLSHIPLLRYANHSGLPLLMSTGVHSVGAIEEAIVAVGTPGIFHCISSYPAPLESLNLATIAFLKQAFGRPTGFSDHSTDPVRAPALATALGANLLEKHFTLNRNLPGTDHFFALEPDELKGLVVAVRQVENDPAYSNAVLNDPQNARLIGEVRRGVFEQEKNFSQRTRLGLYFRRDVNAGEVVGKDDVRVFRCADTEPGLHPRYLELVRGARLVRGGSAYSAVFWDHIIDRTDL